MSELSCDYYEILDSPPTATADEIRSAYRRLALKYHPDQSQRPDANRRMQLLNEAYEVLGNPEKKAQYDQERIVPAPEPAKERPTTPEPAAPNQPTSSAPTGEGAEKSAEPEPTPREQPVVRSRWGPEQIKWLRNQLKIIAQLIFLVTILFFWSLFSGQVSLVLIAAPILVAFVVIISIVARIRKPA